MIGCAEGGRASLGSGYFLRGIRELSFVIHRIAAEWRYRKKKGLPLRHRGAFIRSTPELDRLSIHFKMLTAFYYRGGYVRPKKDR